MAENNKKKSAGAVTDIKGVGAARAKKLESAGFQTPKDVAEASVEDLTATGMSESLAKKIRSSAKKIVPSTPKKKQQPSVRVTDPSARPQMPSRPRGWRPVAITTLVILLVAVAVLFASGFLEQGSVVDNSSPVAEINGETITEAQLEEQYQGLPMQLQQQYSREDVLRQLVDKQLILSYAQVQGIEVSQEQAQQRVQQQITDLNISQSELESVLASSNVTYEEYRDAVREELILEQLLDQLEQNVEITEEQVAALHESLPEEQRQPLDQMRPELEQLLAQQQAGQAFSQLIAQLRAQADIQYYGDYTTLAEGLDQETQQAVVG